MKSNIITRTMFLILFLSIIIQGVIFAQEYVSDISPKGEQGASFQQLITVDWSMSPTPYPDTQVIFNDRRITWRRISESATISPLESYHRGRITIPYDVQPGTYPFRIYNGGFYWGSGAWLNGQLSIFAFQVKVNKVSQAILQPGSSNIQITMDLSTNVTNCLYYGVHGLNSTINGVTLVSGSFLANRQIKITVNVAPNAQPGNLGLYIKYALGKANNMRNPVRQNANPATFDSFPTVVGDYNTIYLDPASGLLSIGVPGPMITSISPNTVARGDTNLSLTVSGVNFSAGTYFTTNHTGVSFSNHTYISPTQMLCSVTASENATLGDVAIAATNEQDQTTTNRNVLRVVSARPVFNGVTPNVLVIGNASQQVCIRGANFTADTYLVFDTDEVYVLNNGYRSSTEMCPTLGVYDWAEPHAVSLSIYNPDGIYTRVQNGLMLSYSGAGDKTIVLLFPGVQGGSPGLTKVDQLSPVELIDNPYPVFRWFSRASKYKISVYKPLMGQTSYQQIINNRPLHEAYVYNTNYFQYPLYARELKPGIRYYWKVDAYFNTLGDQYTERDKDGGMVGEVLSSEVWSFVLRDTTYDPGQTHLKSMSSLNPVETLIIEPSYLEITPGDRASVVLRGVDRYGNYAAFIPRLDILDLKLVESGYPDIKILPKSFGRAEIIVPNVSDNRDFQTRLIRNPGEFSMFPVLLYISKNAKGVGALLATWQDKKYYAMINVLPPKSALLKKGELDRFHIGVASRQSEAFEVVMDEVFQYGSIVNGSGRLFIDSTGFRERGYFAVKVSNVRIDSSGRAYTGSVVFEGAENIELSGFDLKLEKLVITGSAPAEVSGVLSLPMENGVVDLSYTGYLSGLGELRGTAKTEKTISLGKVEIPAESRIELDFSAYWSPEFKQYDPSFRGLIIPVGKDGEVYRWTAVSSPDQFGAIEPEPSTEITASVKPLKIDISNVDFNLTDKSDSLYLSASRSEDGKVELNWLDKEAGVSGYNIYRRTADESEYRLIAERIKTSSFLDLFTDSDKTYWYRIVGLNNEHLEFTKSNLMKIDELEHSNNARNK
jgi:hypothetical protein